MGQHTGPSPDPDEIDGLDAPRLQTTGIVTAAVVAAWTAALVVVFSLALAEVHWALALVVDVVAVVGMYPVVRGWRGRPVYRFLALGLTVGVVLGWLAVLASILG